MKYKNNREAVLGDAVIGTAAGKPFAGVLAAIETQAQTLVQKMRVLVHTHKSEGAPTDKSTYETATILADGAESLHAEDALKPASTAPAKTPAAVEAQPA